VREYLFLSSDRQAEHEALTAQKQIDGVVAAAVLDADYSHVHRAEIKGLKNFQLRTFDIDTEKVHSRNSEVGQKII